MTPCQFFKYSSCIPLDSPSWTFYGVFLTLASCLLLLSSISCFLDCLQVYDPSFEHKNWVTDLYPASELLFGSASTWLSLLAFTSIKKKKNEQFAHRGASVPLIYSNTKTAKLQFLWCCKQEKLEFCFLNIQIAACQWCRNAWLCFPESVHGWWLCLLLWTLKLTFP